MKRENLVRLAFASLMVTNVLMVVGVAIFFWLLFLK